MEGNISVADALALQRNNGNMFGNDNGMMWLLFILLVAGRGAFGFGGGNYESPLISEEFIKRDIFNTNQNVSTTGCQTQRDVLENRYANQLGLQQLQASQQACCCETQKEIIESRYTTQLGLQNLGQQMASCCCDLKSEGFKNTCDILNAIHAEGEATRGLIQANTIQDLRDRLAQSQRETDTANLALQNNAQTQTLLAQINKVPQPAYITCSPYTAYGFNTCTNM